MSSNLATPSNLLGWNNKFVSKEGNIRKSKKKKKSPKKLKSKNKKECKTCNGKGYYTCKVCDGHGIKKIEYVSEDYKSGEWNIRWERLWEPCPRCKGQGRGLICHICKGTGLVR